MILYFSATGNTKLMAEALAERLQDETADLLLRIKNADGSEIYSERPFIICSPIYVSELPVFFAEYLKQVTLKGSREVYGIFTNGGYSGIAGGQLKKIIERKGMQFMGYAEFKLPSNHITNRSHAETKLSEDLGRIRSSLEKADQVAEEIRNGQPFHNRHIFLLEYLVTLPLAPALCYLNQGMKDFRAEETCVSCGKCAALCPMNVIEMRDGLPVWKEKRCAHCMSCIQNCPAEAIEYGKTTEGRRRYSVSRTLKASGNDDAADPER